MGEMRKAEGCTKTPDHRGGVGEAVVRHYSGHLEDAAPMTSEPLPVSGVREVGRGVAIGDPQASLPGTL